MTSTVEPPSKEALNGLLAEMRQNQLGLNNDPSFEVNKHRRDPVCDLANFLHCEPHLTEIQSATRIQELMELSGKGRETLINTMIRWRKTYSFARSRWQQTEQMLKVATQRFNEIAKENHDLKIQIAKLQKGPVLPRVYERLVHSVHKAVHGLHKPESSASELRVLVWNAYKLPTGDRIVCCHCGKLLLFEDYTVEHLKPRALGGTDDIDNLRGACSLCNSRRPLECIYDKFNSRAE